LFANTDVLHRTVIAPGGIVVMHRTWLFVRHCTATVTHVRLTLALLLAVGAIGCSGGPTSPTATTAPSRPTPSLYAGIWAGVTRNRECVVVAGKTNCSDRLRYFRLALSQETVSKVSGQVMVFPHGWITVQGETDSSGTLTLTGNGNGQNYESTSTLDTWQTRVDGVAMTGGFSFTSRPIRDGDPLTVTATLENVFNSDSSEVWRSLPAEATMDLQVEEGTARRLLDVYSTPGVTLYSVSYRVINIWFERARLTFTLTPIGADGRDYAVTQQWGSLPEFVTPGTSRSGCCADARDDDYRRPIAPRYRLRLEFQYEDGRTGVLEETGSVRVVRDDLR
jgi:hypothetical protein